VILSGATLEDAQCVAEALAAERRLVFVHPYDDWDVIAGQASLGLEILEILESLPDLSLLVVPLGGGGLLAGVALAIKLQRPGVRIVGVQSEAVAPFRHFLRDGGVDAIAREVHTIADGVVGLAALMKRVVVPRADDSVAVVISGGNADMTLVGRSIDFGLASSGRLMSVAVTIPDTPGRLAQLLGIVAEHGMNVRHVEHRRGELHVPVGFTEVILQIETRDFAHQQELLAHIAQQGALARNLLPPQA